MKRILAIIMLAITAQAADIVLYSTTAPTAAYPAMVPKTGQTNVYYTGDAGTYQPGVAIPQPRFSYYGSGLGTNVVVDGLTGLMWSKRWNITGYTSWTNAIQQCENLDDGGFTDWRLPTYKELFSLMDYRFYSPCLSESQGTNIWTAAAGPWTAITMDAYWTSTTPYGYDITRAITVNPGNGSVALVAVKANNVGLTVAVRGP